MRKVFVTPAVPLFIAWFLLLRPLFLGGPASYIIVSGISMEPTFHTGDLVITLKQDSYSAGQIVAYATSEGNIIHRIVGGDSEDGYIMKGDNKTDVDPWRPKPSQILGKEWIYIPGAGRIVANLRQPVPLGVTTGILVMIALWKGPGKRVRRRGGKMVRRSSVMGSQQQVYVIIGIIVAIGCALGALAGYAFRQPLQTSEFVERAQYNNTASFDYRVTGQPSILYPDGTIGPVLPPAQPGTKVASPAIYAKLANTMDLGFTYSLNSSLPPNVSGELSVTQEIKAGDSWSKSSELLPPTAFTGTRTSTRVKLDLPQILSLIDAIEKETGYTAGSYTITITPTVHIAGKIGEDGIDDVYAPPFTLKLTKPIFTADQDLLRSETKKLGDNVSRPAEMALAGIKLPVEGTRWAGLAGAIICLLLGGALGVLQLVRENKNESARLSSRYGVRVIAVARSNVDQSTKRVDVATLDDLGLLAQRDGQIVFRGELEGGSPLYFVPEGDVVYSYGLPEKPAEGQVL